MKKLQRRAKHSTEQNNNNSDDKDDKDDKGDITKKEAADGMFQFKLYIDEHVGYYTLE